MKKRGTLVRGQVIDETYEILFYIGEGAFGEVYRVQHKYLGTQVFKLFKEEFEKTVDIEEISREARVLSKVTHPNVVRVFECNSFQLDEQTRHFLTMSFVSGETLTQLLSRRINLSRLEAVNIMIDVLEGLKYVHSMSPPIIHRDINPDNILLSYESVTPRGLLSDFGLAQPLDTDEHLPGAAGRYPYLAPECFWGTYILSSDVFSAGVTLYRAITGIHPWQYELDWVDAEPEVVVTEISKARKQMPRVASFHLEKEDIQLDDILFKAIERNLEKRYRNAGEFLEALKDWRNGVVEDVPQRLREKSNAEVNSKNYSAKKQGKGFDLIAGMHDLKETLFQDIIRPLSEPDIYKEYGVSPPNGMLFYGPPGCGKTYIAKKLAEEIGYHYIEVKPSDLVSTFTNGIQEKIETMFNEAEKKAPTLIFIDEVDAVFPSRNTVNDQYASSEVKDFMAQMTNCAERGIFIVAATNRPENVDSAIMRTGRIDKVVYLSPPDVFARNEMLRFYLKNRPVSENIDLTNIAALMDGYVSSDIKFLVNEASRLALIGRSKISDNHFIAVMKEHQPSISRDQIRSYEKFCNSRTFITNP
ncbi:MAG: AAA family ATPase [Chlorobiaceae bacterium]|nr:AAA family ATPase [Chlorobiaceae bacterium]